MLQNRFFLFLLRRRERSGFGAAISDVITRSSFVFCNSVCADRYVMAASRLLGACKVHAAITMRFAASRGQHASLYAHGNKTRQQSRSHCTKICNQKVNKRKESRTHEQPLVAEHRGGTDYALRRSKPHQKHTRGTFHGQLQPLYTEKHKVSCSGFSPNTRPSQPS